MHSVRRRNLRALIATNYRSVADFSHQHGISESQLSQWLSSTYRHGNNFGEKAARKLELTIGLAPLTLDALGEVDLPPPARNHPNAEDSCEIKIRDMSVGTAKGNKTSSSKHANTVERIAVSVSWLKSRVKFNDVNTLSLTTAHGDSMEGTFSDGDTLLVDHSVHEIGIDAIYVLTLNNELYVRRLQSCPDGTVLMISDNKRYSPYVIKGRSLSSLHVLGRVLLAWNAGKL
ncbi:MAG: helix-turn-helix transcriptional regulator [Burkholderiales bacterium]